MHVQSTSYIFNIKLQIQFRCHLSDLIGSVRGNKDFDFFFIQKPKKDEILWRVESCEPIYFELLKKHISDEEWSLVHVSYLLM